jgi:hypothetical protein
MIADLARTGAEWALLIIIGGVALARGCRGMAAPLIRRRRRRGRKV